MPRASMPAMLASLKKPLSNAAAAGWPSSGASASSVGRASALSFGWFERPLATIKITTCRYVWLHRRLGIGVLIKTMIGAVFHDARFGIGEVVLVFVLRPQHMC